MESGRPDPPRVREPGVRVEVRRDLVSVLGQRRGLDALDLVGAHGAGRLVVADEVDAPQRGVGLEEVGMDAGPLLGSRARVVHDLDHAALGPAAGDGAEAAGERLVQVVRADGQHRRGHVTRDRLRQRIGELREGADDGRVVLVAPPRDQPRREEEDDRLGHGEAQRWQEELAIDPVVAAPGLEDRNAQLLVEGVEVAVHGSGGHPGQPGDLADGDTGLGPALRVEDRDDAQQPRQPIALARDPVVATITPARPTVSLVQHGADDRPMGVSPRQTRWAPATATASAMAPACGSVPARRGAAGSPPG